MKTITIGRGEGCNIYIDDESMSRRHAIIKIPTFGGMEIVDMSKNGTFVNGVRLRPNVPFPVKRTDVVNFADVQQLDWSLVPDPMKYYKLGAIIVGGVVVLLLAIFFIKSLFSGPSEETAPVQSAVEQIDQKAPATESQLSDEPAAEPQQEAPAEGTAETAPPADNTPEATTGSGNQVIDVYGAARTAKKKREAEERARQQKAKEQKQKEQKQKEQQQKEQQKQQENQKQEDNKPADGNSSKKEYNPEMI